MNNFLLNNQKQFNKILIMYSKSNFEEPVSIFSSFFPCRALTFLFLLLV